MLPQLRVVRKGFSCARGNHHRRGWLELGPETVRYDPQSYIRTELAGGDVCPSSKILASIEQAKSARYTSHAADNAEGFLLSMETLKALNAASGEALHPAFEASPSGRRKWPRAVAEHVVTD